MDCGEILMDWRVSFVVWLGGVDVGFGVVMVSVVVVVVVVVVELRSPCSGSLGSGL